MDLFHSRFGGARVEKAQVHLITLTTLTLTNDHEHVQYRGGIQTSLTLSLTPVCFFALAGQKKRKKSFFNLLCLSSSSGTVLLKYTLVYSHCLSMLMKNIFAS